MFDIQRDDFISTAHDFVKWSYQSLSNEIDQFIKASDVRIQNSSEEDQVLYAKAKNFLTGTSFKLTEQSLENLRRQGVPGNILNDLKSQEFTRKEEFLSAIERSTGFLLTVEYEELILKYASTGFQNNILSASEEGEDNLQTLAHKTEGIRHFTKMWILYLEALKQRIKVLEEPFLEVNSFRAINNADRLVRGLYQPNEGHELMRQYPHPPIVVPFLVDIYATGFDSPMPIIVAPIWLYRQAWAWLGYAHEVGHHIYRNVTGLYDELRVNVMFALSSNNVDYEMQNIWFNWLEEIFADVFGLLRVGPTFVHSQQLMLLYLPIKIVRQIQRKKEKVQDCDIIEGLLQPADDTHPVPYLRARIMCKALKLLGEIQGENGLIGEAQLLKKRWTEFVDNTCNRVTTKVQVASRVRHPGRPLTSESRELIEKRVVDMEAVGDIVLNVMLTTKLYALEQQNLMDVFFTTTTEAEVNTAISAISNRTETTAQALLIAAQRGWDGLIDNPQKETFQRLNTDILETIGKLKH